MAVKLLACAGALGVIACLSVGCPQAGARGEGPRMYPTHQSHPKKIKQGFAALGEGRIDAGVDKTPQNFYWWVAAESHTAGPHVGQVCFRLAVIGPLFKGGGPGQVGEDGCLEGEESSAVIAGPLHRSKTWSEFDVGIAAYRNPVSNVRLVFPGGFAKEVLTRQVGRDLGVPELGSLHYVVFAVGRCVKRVEAEEADGSKLVTKLRECR